MKKPTISILFLSLFSAAATQAQTLIGWDVAGITESATSVTYDSGTLGAHISTTSPSGVLSRGSGAAAPGSPSANTFGASGFNAANLGSALTNNDYFTFSISVASGYQMSLTSVSFKMSETTNGATNAALFSSVGGFSSAGMAIATWATPSGTTSDQSITLSGGSFSNLTGTVEFRIFAYGGNSSSTDKFRLRNLSGDDLIIAGSVSAIPEPATYAALLGAASLAGAFAHRRQKISRPPARSTSPSRAA